MVYGRFQYYVDEVNGWSRAITFYKEELRESVRQIGVILEQGIVSPSNGKKCNLLTDQLLVQEQQFDHINHQVLSQQQRLGRILFYFDKPVEYSVSHQQDLLRSKMKNIERIFILQKYNCSVFLSSYLIETPLAVVS